MQIELQSQINALKQRIDDLSEELIELKRRISEESPVRVRVVEIKDFTNAEAEQLILKYLETHKVTYPDDIADELGLDLKLTMEVVERLMKENKIKEAPE